MKGLIAEIGAVAGLSALSCSSSGVEDEMPLIDSVAWTSPEAKDDPFFAQDADDESVFCTAQAWTAESESTEINTTTCNYLTLVQPTGRAILAGDELHLSVWWQTLASERPATGHFAIYIDDVAIFDERIAIPANADARDIHLASPRDFPPGTPVYLHVHNHGFNSWTLGSLELHH